jgi:GNAT superfamily N-acetyltransferase
MLSAAVGRRQVTSKYPTGNALKRAIAVLREEGLRSFWFKLIGELGYRRMLVVEYRLDDPVPAFSARLPVRNDLLKASEVNAYLAFRPEIGQTEVINRLKSSQLCFVAWHEGRIVSACWSSAPPVQIEYLACESQLGDGDAYLYDKFTLPAYRGHRIANAVRVYQLQHLRQAGYRRAIGALVPENKTALRDNAKGGFRPVGMIGRIKIGPWQRIFRRTWDS